MQPAELKAWRQKLGLTQDKAGGLLGVSRVAFQNWESGGTPIPKMADDACWRHAEHWMKEQRRRPEYGPVILFSCTVPLGTPKHILRTNYKDFDSNDLALQNVRASWGQLNFHDPSIIDHQGNVIWNHAELREEIDRRIAADEARAQTPGLAEELLEIGRRFSALPVEDERSEDEILGYDEHGLPR